MANSKSGDNVRVAIRCRPLSDNEAKKGFHVVVHVDELNGEIRLQPEGSTQSAHSRDERSYFYDNVFGMDSKQADVFNVVARPIVDFVLEGYNGTIFAYGQTGTGKTYTMEGDRGVPELKGIIPNSFAHVFAHISKSEGEIQFLVHVSYLEIYNEEVRDLLGKDPSAKLEVKERPDIGVYVKDLSTFVVKGPEHMDKLMKKGAKNRKFGVTDMNEHSSRSHTIFTVTVESSEWGKDNKQHVKMGKLHLVDLAGSERQSKTGATGERLKEAAKINLSLMTLGNVISALVDGNQKTHVPYRTSQLTRLLQDSLGGNSKTVMIANIGPASYNVSETANTLRYANRAKNIQNKAKINEDPKDALLREFQKEIELLKKKLTECDSGSEEEATDEEGTPRKVKTPVRAMTPKRIASARAKLEEERAAVLAQKGMAQAERDRIASQLQEKEKDLETAQTEYTKMEQKLQDLQGKVIIGGVNLLEKAEEQEKLLEESRKKLEERRIKEMALKKKLKETEAERVDYVEKYATLQEEAASKTKKLKVLWKQLQAANSELAEMREEYQRENEDILENIRQLVKEIKLQSVIINYYVPLEYQAVLHDSSEWDEERGEWHMKGLAYAGNNVKQTLTPEQSPKRFDTYDPTQSYLTYASLEEASSSGKGMKKSHSKTRSRVLT